MELTERERTIANIAVLQYQINKLNEEMENLHLRKSYLEAQLQANVKEPKDDTK